MTDLPTLLRGVDDRFAQQQRLRAGLDKSLLIQATWPDAFEYGPVKLGARVTTAEPHKGVVILTRGDGTKIEAPAINVPFELWPVAMQADYMAMPSWKRATVGKTLKRAAT